MLVLDLAGLYAVDEYDFLDVLSICLLVGMTGLATLYNPYDASTLSV